MPGSTATRWRDAFLAFDREDKLVSSDIVETFLGEIASPQQFIDLLEALVQEKLLKRDGRQLEELVLQHVDATGQWTHQQGRRQSA